MDIVQGRCGGVFVIDESGPVVMEAGQGGTTRGGTVGGDERRREARRESAPSLFDGRRFDDGAWATMGRWDDAMGWGRGDACVGAFAVDEGRRGATFRAREWMRR